MNWNNKVGRTFSILALLSLFTYCIIGCQDKQAKQPEFKAVINLNIDDISKKNFDLTGSIIFVNNSDESFDAVKVIADITLDRADVATFLFRKPLSIPAGKELTIPLIVTLDQSAISTAAPDLMQVIFEIKGEVQFENSQHEKVDVNFLDKQKVLITDKRMNKESKRSLRKKRRKARKQ